MVILKKINASTLVETITASLIILIVFTIASLTLNNVFATTIKNDTNQIENHMYKLEYLFKHNKVVVPYKANFSNWQVSIFNEEINNLNWVVFKAEHKKNQKSVLKKRLDVAE